MLAQLDDTIVALRGARIVHVARSAPVDRVQALKAMGYGEEVARVFGFGGAERSQVVWLAKRKGLVTA